jgi:hypothetical protein
VLRNCDALADLEIGDTAGLETCATEVDDALAFLGALCQSPAMQRVAGEPNPGLERTRHQLRASGTKDETQNPLRSGIHTRGYLPHVKREGACYFGDVSFG